MSSLVICPRGSQCLSGATHHKNGSQALKDCQNAGAITISSASVIVSDIYSDLESGTPKITDSRLVDEHTDLSDIADTVRTASIFDSATNGLTVKGFLDNRRTQVHYRESYTKNRDVQGMGRDYIRIEGVDVDKILDDNDCSREELERFIGTSLIVAMEKSINEHDAPGISVDFDTQSDHGETSFEISYIMEKSDDQPAYTVGDMQDIMADSEKPSMILDVMEGIYPHTITDEVNNDIDNGGMGKYLAVKKNIGSNIDHYDRVMSDDAGSDVARYPRFLGDTEEVGLIYRAAKKNGCITEDEFGMFSSGVLSVNSGSLPGYQLDEDIPVYYDADTGNPYRREEDVNDVNQHFQEEKVDGDTYVYVKREWNDPLKWSDRF